ncbi:MAG: hypothetical protein U9Q91_03830, partial [Candidatus Marinimicrobia bacterium]|nr:hypothetical protein [Candidatus Neomarinimicrobiota bacterium]
YSKKTFFIEALQAMYNLKDISGNPPILRNKGGEDVTINEMGYQFIELNSFFGAGYHLTKLHSP